MLFALLHRDLHQFHYIAKRRIIYNESIDIMNKMQDDYDGQTRNGQEYALQEKWNRFIDDKLTIITR